MSASVIFKRTCLRVCVYTRVCMCVFVLKLKEINHFRTSTPKGEQNKVKQKKRRNRNNSTKKFANYLHEGGLSTSSVYILWSLLFAIRIIFMLYMYMRAEYRS